MKLLQNRKVVILSIVIIVLLVSIGAVIYGIYISNKQQTIAEPIDDEIQKLGNKNVVENNNTVNVTR